MDSRGLVGLISAAGLTPPPAQRHGPALKGPGLRAVQNLACFNRGAGTRGRKRRAGEHKAPRLTSVPPRRELALRVQIGRGDQPTGVLRVSKRQLRTPTAFRNAR